MSRTTSRFMIAGSIGLAVAGLAPAAQSASPRSEAKARVLTHHDVGRGFSERHHSYTPGQLAREGTWTSAQLKAWGYRGGYERVFTRTNSSSPDRQVASNAGVYRSATGARESLIANGNQCTVGRWKELPAPRALGDQALMCTLTGVSDSQEGQLFFVVWRAGRFKGSVSLSGPKGEVTAAEAIALARKQAVKM